MIDASSKLASICSGVTCEVSGRVKQNYMSVSENSGTPKSSISIGFSIINHPFWGTPIFGNTHIHLPKSPFFQSTDASGSMNKSSENFECRAKNLHRFCLAFFLVSNFPTFGRINPVEIQ